MPSLLDGFKVIPLKEKMEDSYLTITADDYGEIIKTEPGYSANPGPAEEGSVPAE